jgi:hypothetical protein
MFGAEKLAPFKQPYRISTKLWSMFPSLLHEFMVFLTGFFNKKIPKMIGIKKTTLSIWTSWFGPFNVTR